uniref:Ectonucleotide pyrophosphatase/phosphodiesterase family member 3 n=1 Tax=Globodera rostochiensis TaxID=31243 RepID=A0A914HHL7_GLORO
MRLNFEDDDEKSPMLRRESDGGGGGAPGLENTGNNRRSKLKEFDSIRRGNRQRVSNGSPPIGGETIRREGFEILDYDDVPNSEKSVGWLRRLIRRRFFLLFLCAAGVAFVLLTVLVLLRSMQMLDEKFEDGINSGKVSSKVGSERFMRIYERIMRFRVNRYFTGDAMISNMPEDELAQAKAAGIFGDEPSGAFSPSSSTVPTMNGTNKSFEGKETWQAEKMTNSNGFYRHEWHNPKCRIKCEKEDINIPPLVVISLDGFQRGYLHLNIVQTLDRMSECGARADFMFPSYPSRTFPNHHTIATGLWPGVHGVIDNTAYDAQISPKLEDMKNTKNAAFYGGEPIWSLAVRQHKRMFCLFWPGCSLNITGHNPTVDLPYNSSFPYSKRVDKIVEWLTLPAIERPSLIMAYFDQPDNVGHFHTSEKQVELELVYLESVLDYLFSSLRREEMLDCINLIILSDHGMQWLNERFYFNELFGPTAQSSGLIASNGVIGHVYVTNHTNSTESEKIQLLDKFTCFDKTKFHLYDRKRMPKRYQYARQKRVGDLVFDGRPGVAFYASSNDDYNVTSDHGYDYRFEQMHAIFFARGPNIRKGIRLEPFQNVELFNLFIDLLRLPQNTPNNGTLGVLDGLIHNMDLHRPPVFPFDPEVHPLGECVGSSQQHHLTPCDGITSAECEHKIKAIEQKLDACRKHQSHPPNAFFYTKFHNLCIINLCAALLLTPFVDGKVGPTMLYESLSSSDFVNASSFECPFSDKQFDKNCQNSMKNAPNGTVWRSIAASEENVYSISDFAQLQFPMFGLFAEGPFTYLQNITRHYVRLFGKVVSITGTITDQDMDGIADQRNSSVLKTTIIPPTHFFRILIRCEDDLWHLNGINCKSANATRLLTFVLPNVRKELNCLGPDEYLLVNTARVRDVELLTGVQFFAEQMWYPTADQLRWRTNITTELWH